MCSQSLRALAKQSSAKLDYRVAAFFVMTMVGSNAYATGLTPDEVKKVNTLCVNDAPLVCKGGWCAPESKVCNEKFVLKQYPNLAQRKGDKLILNTEVGEKIFKNKWEGEEKDPDGKASSSYKLIAYIPELNAYIINGSGYEEYWTIYLDRKTGKETILGGYIGTLSSLQFSPDGTRMLDDNSYESNLWSAERAINIYDYSKESGLKIHTKNLKPCTEDVTNLAPCCLTTTWKDNETIAFTSNYTDTPQPTYTCNITSH